MSWYVEELLKNSSKIRDRLDYEDLSNVRYFPNSLYNGTPVFFTEGNIFDDDTYSDLLSVEIAINALKDRKNISDTELKMIDLLYEGASFTDIMLALHITKPTVLKMFKELCDRIAFYLGDFFTDEGYLEYMNEKYNLRDDEYEKLYRIIKRNSR